MIVRRKPSVYAVLVPCPVPWGSTPAVDQKDLANHLFARLGVERPSRAPARLYHLTDPGGQEIYADAVRIACEGLRQQGARAITSSERTRWSGETDCRLHYRAASDDLVEQALFVIGFGPCPLPYSIWERILDESSIDG